MRAANVMAILGLATVGLAVSAAVLLVTSYVADTLTAALITAFVFLLVRRAVVRLPARPPPLSRSGPPLPTRPRPHRRPS